MYHGMDHNRRSFVDHKRKSLTFNNIFTDDTQEECKAEKPKLSVTCYLESLKKEKQEWKDILKEKKNKCKEYETLYKSDHLTITRVDVEQYLTPDNIKFLESKPSYLEMAELVRKYVDSIKYLSKYKSDIIDYYNKAYNQLEMDKKILVEEMCASKLCEICNLKNCQKPDHKFNV